MIQLQLGLERSVFIFIIMRLFLHFTEQYICFLFKVLYVELQRGQILMSSCFTRNRRCLVRIEVSRLHLSTQYLEQKRLPLFLRILDESNLEVMSLRQR